MQYFVRVGQLLIVIIQLMFSVYVSPNGIKLSNFDYICKYEL